MRNLGAVELKASLDYASIVDTLDAAYRADITVPERSHLTVPVAGGADMTMLVMPAWDASDFIGRVFSGGCGEHRDAEQALRIGRGELT